MRKEIISIVILLALLFFGKMIHRLTDFHTLLRFIGHALHLPENLLQPISQASSTRPTRLNKHIEDFYKNLATLPIILQ